MKKKLLICRCEEVNEEEVRQAVRDGADSITGVKRRTRAGMGLCQGHTCSRLIGRIIAAETGKSLAEIPPTTVRPPVRPISVKALSSGPDGGLKQGDRVKAPELSRKDLFEWED